MEYPEDKVIISRSKLEAEMEAELAAMEAELAAMEAELEAELAAMEAELAAYKNSRQHKPVCDLLP